LNPAALELFPDATVLHLGLFRDKTTLQAIEYYSKLPRQVTADLVYVLDRECSLKPLLFELGLPQPSSTKHSALQLSHPRISIDTLPALIATGGTAVAALGMLTEWGLQPSQIKIVSILGSKAGVAHVQEEFPEVDIYIGAIDDLLTDKGYISPGLGDAGDRMYNTI
jgi:uracil phosphoribosyltransferase